MTFRMEDIKLDSVIEFVKKLKSEYAQAKAQKQSEASYLNVFNYFNPTKNDTVNLERLKDISLIQQIIQFMLHNKVKCRTLGSSLSKPMLYSQAVLAPGDSAVLGMMIGVLVYELYQIQQTYWRTSAFLNSDLARIITEFLKIKDLNELGADASKSLGLFEKFLREPRIKTQWKEGMTNIQFADQVKDLIERVNKSLAESNVEDRSLVAAN